MERAIAWQEAQALKQELAERSRYKDMDLAMLIANGETLTKAAAAIGMREDLARAIVLTPMFGRLVARLRSEREAAVYNPDPDEGIENEARSNYLTMRQARDMGETMGLRLKAAQILHEARPSIRRQKIEESTIRVVFAVEDTKRLMEGFAKATGRDIESVEAEFEEVGEAGGKEEAAAEEAGVGVMQEAEEAARDAAAEEEASQQVKEIVGGKGRRAMSLDNPEEARESSGTIPPENLAAAREWGKAQPELWGGGKPRGLFLPEDLGVAKAWKDVTPKAEGTGGEE